MINPFVSERISMLRTLLILSVVVLHVVAAPPAAQVDFSDLATVLRCIFVDRFGRFAVPTLSMVSGYLLFSARLDQTPLKLYKKKFTTLAVPFFFFNIVFSGVVYSIEYVTGSAPLYGLTGKDLPSLLNGLLGYSEVPFNVPLHFLRDLFVLALLAPLFGVVIRRLPWLGLALVCGIFLPDLDGHLVNRDTMAVLFYVGGMAGAGHWDLRKYDRFAVPAMAALVGLCAAVVLFRVHAHTIVYLASPPLVWIASARLIGTRLGNWALENSKYSFFIFLAHSPMLRLITLAELEFHVHMPVMLTIAVNAILATALLRVVYEAAVLAMPRAFHVMVGARTARPALPALPRPVERPMFVERRKAPRPAGAPVYSETLRTKLLATLDEVVTATAELEELRRSETAARV